MISAYDLRSAANPLFAALLAALAPLTAQALDPALPGAGSILQQVQPLLPPTPSPSGTGLTTQSPEGARLPASAPIHVTSLQITGNTVFDTASLYALVANAEGQSLTLSQLDAVAARITAYYRSHGYPLARALIPAQTIQAGVVRIQIIEAHYGKIGLENSSRVHDALLAATLSPLQAGQVIGQSSLESSLLLLSDIPGVLVAASLRPGQTVGTSDLLVNTSPGPAVTGNVALDDYGDRYTGRARAGGTVKFINPLHHGDVLSADGLTTGDGLNYGRIAYESVLNGEGTRVGGAYSALHYTLGESLASLDAHGTAQVQSIWAKQPLVRSRALNLYGQIEYDQLQLRDHIDTSAIRTDRHLGNTTLSLSGDARDMLLSDAVSSWNVGWTAGRVGFDDAAAEQADAQSARTQRSFSKWNANLARLQSLGASNALYLAVSGQWANTNLDASQKMTAGGPFSVRAYDTGAVAGDTGYLASIELRHTLDLAWGGQWQAVAFVDSAHVTINENAWVAGTNSATLSGAGVGLNWAGVDQWSARIYLATPVGATPLLVAGTSSMRAWLELRKDF